MSTLTIRGEIETSVRARAQYSTDASNYRVVPQMVVHPMDDDDVKAIIRYASEEGIPLTSRGGGTSVAGNSIGEGIVMDFSRHMNKILEIDPVARTARVQPGVVMSDLQKAAAPFGLRFGPDPSTQNRATFGGMIGNNACGPHAVAYGRTADNVQGLHMYLMPHEAGGEIEEIIAGQGDCQIPGLERAIDDHLALIRTQLGRFSRQVSGYSLEHLLPENGRNLAKMLVGTEGTLGVITEATLTLVPMAAKPTLVILGYPDMAAAADAVPGLLEHKPLAVEGIDSRLVEVVRAHKGTVPELPPGGGWLFIEVGAHEGEDPEIVPGRAQAIVEASGTDSHRICPAGPEATELWRIRADGVGLAGRTPAGNPAWPGWEDSAVLPERLGDYLRGLEKVMADHGVDGLMYGHFGDGCVHVRIDFPIDTATGVPVFRSFMEAAADLALSMGGSLSGEHGDGRARSELLTKMYTPELIDLFAHIKHLFDPRGLLNPGVLVRPRPLDADLRRPAAQMVGYEGGFHFTEDDGNLTQAFHRCTGVGNCRADRFDAGFFMCPSYRATKDEKDVTRGRMRVLQDLVRGDFVRPADALESLDLCLSCKACSRDCPTGIDVARYKAEVLFRTYKGKLRPRTHYLLGSLPRMAKLMTAVPPVAALANAVMRTPIRKLALWAGGMDPARKVPAFTTKRFSRTARSLPTVHILSARDAARLERPVLLWADSFSENMDSRGATAAIEVLTRAGYSVIVPERQPCCGLTLISTGQLTAAKARLTDLLSILAPYCAAGIPIVGVEPSCTGVLRSDLEDLLPEDARTELVKGMTYTLAELLTSKDHLAPKNFTLPDLSGLTVIAQPHCHHYSVMGWQADRSLLEAAGAKLSILSGCCGLAGNFGMEKGHHDISLAVANNSLKPALDAAEDDAVYLADGFSCRTQAEYVSGSGGGVHLAELLRDGANVRRHRS